MRLNTDWLPDPWVIEEELLRQERERAERRPYLEMPAPCQPHEAEREEAPAPSTVIIIDLSSASSTHHARSM